MVSKRKVFNCGHTGFGKYCHLCKQLKSGELKTNEFGKHMPNPEHISESMKKEREINRQIAELK